MKRLMVRCSSCEWKGQRVGLGKCPGCGEDLVLQKRMTPGQRSAMSRKLGAVAGARFQSGPEKGRALQIPLDKA